MTSRTPSRSVSRSVSSNSLPPRRATPAVELSPADKEKETLIRAACEDGDVDTLVRLATSNSGLVSDSLRRTACRSPTHRAATIPGPLLTNTGPLLLGCADHVHGSQQVPWTELPEHKDEHQVGLDVNRAFVYYPKNGMPLARASYRNSQH